MPFQPRSQSSPVNKNFEKKRMSEEYYVEKGLAANPPSDTRIQECVWHFLKNFPGLDVAEIEVDVRDSNLTLLGTFPDEQMQGRVVHGLRGVQGVRHVRDRTRILKKQEVIIPKSES